MEVHGQCIGVVSGKGGTGKTSFTAGVGAALALSGQRVLCLDCDTGLRNLDLALGLSDRALMDFSDVAQASVFAFPVPFAFGLEFHPDAILMMILMYIGRVGPMTIALLFAGKVNLKEKLRTLPSERIMIG